MEQRNELKTVPIFSTALAFLHVSHNAYSFESLTIAFFRSLAHFQSDIFFFSWFPSFSLCFSNSWYNQSQTFMITRFWPWLSQEWILEVVWFHSWWSSHRSESSWEQTVDESRWWDGQLGLPSLTAVQEFVMFIPRMLWTDCSLLSQSYLLLHLLVISGRFRCSNKGCILTVYNLWTAYQSRFYSQKLCLSKFQL